MTDQPQNYNPDGLRYGQHDTAPFRNHRQSLAALALKLAGASYPEISDALGFATPEQAREAVEGHLANDARRDPEALALLREEESQRLMRLLRSVWTKATTPDNPEHLAAVKVALSISDRHARLRGLDAPTQIHLSNPAAEELEAWVSEALTAQHAPLVAIEANVVTPD